MKAIVCKKYGNPASLKLEEIAIPDPAENEVLVKVKATAINDWDWALVRGRPYLYRLMFGLFKPKKQVFGVELAGVVESVGSEVRNFKQGDRVYGDISENGFGAWAEFAAVHESALALMPENMPFEVAAALPHASLLAYQGLIKAGELSEGQEILINGAGGGVGTLGIQIAKMKNVHVTGVDSKEKLAMMRDLGYDEVMDYRKTDFTRTGRQYDLVLDTKTTRGPFSLSRSLKSFGIYATVGGHLNRLLQMALFKGLITMNNNQRFQLVVLKPNEGLDYISEMYGQRKISTVIDGPYTLEEIPEQLERFGAGLHKGKIVISI